VRPFADAWREILERPEGPLAFRFYLQPLMAILFAVRDGIRDAKAGRPAYLWSIFTDPGRRRERLRDGWRSVGKIFVLALVLDVLYQLVVLRGLRPLEGGLVALTLALVPYVLFRGPTSRLFRAVGREKAGAHQRLTSTAKR
jgi:hypothetical protein